MEAFRSNPQYTFLFSQFKRKIKCENLGEVWRFGSSSCLRDQRNDWARECHMIDRIPYGPVDINCHKGRKRPESCSSIYK